MPERRAAFIAAVTSRLLGTPGDDDAAAAPETLPFFPLSDGDLAADEWGESRPPPERRVLEYFAAGASGDSGSALIASAAARTDAAADPDRPPVATWSSLRCATTSSRMVRMAAISSFGFALPSRAAGFNANKPVAGCEPGAGCKGAGSNSFLADCGADCGRGAVAFFLFCPGGGVRGFGSARGSRPLARRSSAWRWRIAATDIFLGGGAPRPPPCVFVFGGVLGGGRAVPGADRGRSGAGSPPIRTTTSGESSHPGFRAGP